MKLNENPIFLTQKRLVHRGGVVAPVLIAALIGLSLLAGLVAVRAVPANFPGYRSLQDSGKIFYGWTIGAEILMLVIVGMFRISNRLTEERKAGLWDSNRLSPLTPSQIVLGYWLGPALREFYMALVLAGTGLMIVVLAQLPVTLWLGTQFLILSTALFFGLLTLSTGLALQRTQSSMIGILFLLAAQPFSFIFPRLVLTNFLLPTYGIANLFAGERVFTPNFSNHDWADWPHLFGLPIPPIGLTIALQLSLGLLLWRGATRKTANPFQPLMLRSEAAAIFGILLLAQQGLLWGLWQGRFPVMNSIGNQFSGDDSSLLAIVHGGTIFLAILILAAASPQPETVRVTALRREVRSFGAIFSRSSVSLALILGAIAGAALFFQFMQSFSRSYETYLIAVGNLLAVFLIFALLLEFCRLRHKRRALGFLALWLFALCLLPLILAGVFFKGEIAKLSLLAPGVIACSGVHDENLNALAGIAAGHLGIALVLLFLWQREWRQLLAKASP